MKDVPLIAKEESDAINSMAKAFLANSRPYKHGKTA